MRDWSEAAGRRPRTSAAYDGDPASIAAARDVVGTFLADLHDRDGSPVTARVTRTAQLVVSELIPNACKYAPGPCTLDLEADVAEGRLEIAVWDTVPSPPKSQAAEPGRIGQHGLEIVLALCEGFAVRPEPVGKTVVTRVNLAFGAGACRRQPLEPRFAPPGHAVPAVTAPLRPTGDVARTKKLIAPAKGTMERSRKTRKGTDGGPEGH